MNAHYKEVVQYTVPFLYNFKNTRVIKIKKKQIALITTLKCIYKKKYFKKGRKRKYFGFAI